MMNNLEGRIRELLSEILKEMEGYLVDLRVLPDKVQVFADRDPHITIEDCAKISRTLGRTLDEEFGFSNRYVLEVSSPGMDQPLKVSQQYKKNFGRTVDVLLVTGIKKRGTLLFADDDKLIIEEQRPASKKDKEVIQSEIPFIQIKSTNLVFNF